MFCYIVFEKSTNKQLRVFPYDPLIKGDFIRAKALSCSFAQSLHLKGYPCIVERMAACSVGILDFDTEENQQ